MTSNHHILESISILGFCFWPCFFYQRWPSLSVVMTIFGKSRDWPKKPYEQKPNGRVHLRCKICSMDLLKCVLWIKLWRHKTLWRHSIFSNANFNKSMLQILLLNTLYPLALVSIEKDLSCVSLYGFCILITWLTKYGHDYQNWRQPLKEQTWPKTKPRILREPKIRRLEVICSSHFVVKGLPLKQFSSCILKFSMVLFIVSTRLIFLKRSQWPSISIKYYYFLHRQVTCYMNVIIIGN